MGGPARPRISEEKTTYRRMGRGEVTKIPTSVVEIFPPSAGRAGPENHEIPIERGPLYNVKNRKSGISGNLATLRSVL